MRMKKEFVKETAGAKEKTRLVFVCPHDKIRQYGEWAHKISVSIPLSGLSIVVPVRCSIPRKRRKGKKNR